MEISRSEGQVTLPDEKFGDFSGLQDSLDKSVKRMDEMASFARSNAQEGKRSMVDTNNLLNLEESSGEEEEDYDQDNSDNLSEGEIKLSKGLRIFEVERNKK